MLVNPADARLLRLVALIGMAGPSTFGALLIALTLTEYDFMRSLGWSPLVVIDWPSGLALGPYGGWMSAGFVGGGLALMLFALGLRRLLPNSITYGFFFITGIGMLLLVAPTDPTFRSTPATWHGILHDSAYALLGLGFAPGMVALARQLGRLPEWQRDARLTWGALALILPAFALKGIGMYLFLFITLTWYTLIAARIWQLARENKT